MSEETVDTRLARIETKLDAALETLRDHEGRLRWVNNEAWLHRGGLGVITFMLAHKLGVFHGFG